jgi:hypothetical protein
VSMLVVVRFVRFFFFCALRLFRIRNDGIVFKRLVPCQFCRGNGCDVC